MSQNEDAQKQESGDASADALAAVSIVLIPVVAVVFYPCSMSTQLLPLVLNSILTFWTTAS